MTRVKSTTKQTLAQAIQFMLLNWAKLSSETAIRVTFHDSLIELSDKA